MEYIDLKAQYSCLEKEINHNIKNVLEQGDYIMGDYVKQLEKELSDYVGAKHCFTCANGTDALSIALMCYDVKPNDCIFVPSFTFFSTAEVVSLLGATPIFIDSNERTFNIDVNKLENAILKVEKEGKLNPRGIISVDLFGLPADYTKIIPLAKKHNLFLIEDGAQGFGGTLNGKKACSFGDISTTSFFPAKPLGCYGDGGAIFTDDDKLAELINSYRVHGKGSFKYDNIRVGLNSRLDTLQAAILLPKLKAFREYEMENRTKFAHLYTEKLKNYVKTPFIDQGYASSYAQYTLIFESEKKRDFVKEYLAKKDIPTMIYYYKPLHQQKVYADYNFNNEELLVSENLSKCVLSLPFHPYLNGDIINDIANSVVEAIGAFKNE